ncbi:MAG: NHLP bacteriocin export ABC transporter permease/ATPase subunit [Rhodospirillaceae bacterium]
MLTTSAQTTRPPARQVLDKDDTVWVISGAAVEIFVGDAGGALPLAHIATMPPGSVVFGSNAKQSGARLVADIADGATLVAMPITSIAESISAPNARPGWHWAVNTWLTALETRLSCDHSPESGKEKVLTAPTLALTMGDRVRAEASVIWCNVQEGPVLLRGEVPLYAPVEPPGKLLVAISRWIWLEATLAGSVERTICPFETGEIGGDAAAAAFTEAAVRELLLRLQERTKTDENMLIRRQIRANSGLTRALTDLVALVDARPRTAPTADAQDALYDACGSVCDKLGIPFKRGPYRRTTDPVTLGDIAMVAGFRRRRVKLRGIWWREDLGPLLGYLGEERLPVALLFDTMRGGYRLVQSGKDSQVVNATLGTRLHPTAEMCYAPLPGVPIGVFDVLQFGLRQCQGDIIFLIVASIMVAGLGLAVPLGTSAIFGTIVPSHDGGKLVEVGLALIILALTTTVFQLTSDISSLRIQGRISGTVLAAIWDRLLRLPHCFFSGFSPGDLNLRAQSIETFSRAVATISVTVANTGILLLFNLAMMAIWIPAAAAIAVGLNIILTAITVLAIHYQRKAIFEGEEVAGDLTSIVTELVGGVAKLRLAGAEVRAYTRWAATFSELRRRAITSQRVGIAFSIFISGFEVTCLALMFSTIVYWADSNLALGNFLGFLAAFTIFQKSSTAMASSCLGIANLMPQAARVRPILQATPQAEEGNVDPRQLTGAIEINNVVFGYGDRQDPVLSGVSMKIAPGQFVAIVGASGCGKSTLMRLLLGWENPWAGAIFYDRHDLRMLSRRAVRRQIGVVLQSGKLMPGTLFENIVGADNHNLDDAWEAARTAGIDSDIRAMPMGMHTMLTEGAAALSGGQVQRLMIARAVIGKPPILMFDEATSSLDNLSQAMISAHLRRIAATRVVIAHRLSTIREADLIYVLAKGRVIETGTYEQLAAAKKTFSSLAV